MSARNPSQVPLSSAPSQFFRPAYLPFQNLNGPHSKLPPGVALGCHGDTRLSPSAQDTPSEAEIKQEDTERGDRAQQVAWAGLRWSGMGWARPAGEEGVRETGTRGGDRSPEGTAQRGQQGGPEGSGARGEWSCSTAPASACS